MDKTTKEILADIKIQVGDAPSNGPGSIEYNIIEGILKNMIYALPAQNKRVSSNTIVQAGNDANYTDYLGKIIVLTSGAVLMLEPGLPAPFSFWVRSKGKSGYVKLPGGSVRTIPPDQAAIEVSHEGGDQYYIDRPAAVTQPGGTVVAKASERFVSENATLVKEDDSKRINLRLATKSIDLQLDNNMGEVFWISIHNPTDFKHRLKLVEGVQTFRKADNQVVAAGVEVYVLPRSTVFVNRINTNEFLLEDGVGDGWLYEQAAQGGMQGILVGLIDAEWNADDFSDGVLADSVGAKHLTSTGLASPTLVNDYIEFNGTTQGLQYAGQTNFAESILIGVAKVTSITTDDMRIGFFIPNADTCVITNIDQNKKEIYRRLPFFNNLQSTADFVVGDKVMFFLKYSQSNTYFRMGKLSAATFDTQEIPMPNVPPGLQGVCLGYDPRGAGKVPIFSRASFRHVFQLSDTPDEQVINAVFQEFKTMYI